MQPISEMPVTVLQGVRNVLMDIDDTITTEGRLPASSYAALEDMYKAGLRVIPITGRPAGWCDMIARFWPVTGVIGENGALHFHYDRASKRMHRTYAQSDVDRKSHREKMVSLGETILAQVPGCRIASDQNYRECDLAIDFCEDVPPLPAEDAKRIATIFEKNGAKAKISSIHVNGWFGVFDKLTTTHAFFRDVLTENLSASMPTCIFVGDSPNDAPMFSFFDHSVGVANVRDFEAHLPSKPKWITKSRSGTGFAEICRLILDARLPDRKA